MPIIKVQIKMGVGEDEDYFTKNWVSGVRDRKKSYADKKTKNKNWKWEEIRP